MDAMRTMSPDRARRLAYRLGCLSLLMLGTGPGLLLVAQGDSLLFALTFGAVQLTTGVIGAVVAARLPGNAVGWVLLEIGVGLGFSVSAAAYGELGISSSSGLPGDHIAAWIGTWTFVPVIYVGIVLLLYLFPDGRFMSRRWKRIAIASLAIVLFATVGQAFAPGPLDGASDIDNPLGASGGLGDAIIGLRNLGNLLGLPATLLALSGIVVRFRRSRGIERQQLKWITFSLALIAVSAAVNVPNIGTNVPFFITMLAVASLPVAIGVAMLRYRLYDIDVVINRALVYAVLTATLAGAYLGTVLLLQLILSGVTSNSSLAVAASTLAVAALFQPARRRIQAAVDRRFYRRKYDAAQTLARFGARLRDEVDLDALGVELRGVVADTMQPAHVSLWLRAPDPG
ncbi:MAG: hypothetical protein QOG15_212 [Solirubrobacteraceae bacterium]|jgi:hypothetical protein|nr:hypothetical protein [Solirubrobacteraceae bacterium]